MISFVLVKPLKRDDQKSDDVESLTDYGVPILAHEIPLFEKDATFQIIWTRATWAIAPHSTALLWRMTDLTPAALGF
jgi:hypothetical protein